MIVHEFGDAPQTWLGRDTSSIATDHSAIPNAAVRRRALNERRPPFPFPGAGVGEGLGLLRRLAPQEGLIRGPAGSISGGGIGLADRQGEHCGFLG